jgi:hypothetical protein
MSRHIKKKHTEYADLNFPKPLSSADKALKRRRDVAINQKKYYHKSLKFEIRNQRDYYRYANNAISNVFGNKVKAYIKDLLVFHGVIPEILESFDPDEAAADTETEISRRYRKDLFES